MTTVLTGLAVARDGSNNGTTPKGFRLAIGGLLAKNGASGVDVRKGVLWDNGGAVVTGNAGMTYSVRSCNAVVMPSTTQGPVIVPNDATISIATTAAPGSNSRIDVIWVRQHLVAADGGSDSDVIGEWGVTQGAVAASPTAPAIPTGAVELARATVTAGTTATNTLTISQTHLWTCADGAPIPVRNDTERDALSEFPGLMANHLGSGRILRWDGSNWQPVGGRASAAGSGTSPTVAAVNTTYTRAITFPAGRFTVPPIVTPTLPLILIPPANTWIWVENVTTAGADINVRRSVTSAGVDFNWTAIEPG